MMQIKVSRFFCFFFIKLRNVLLYYCIINTVLSLTISYVVPHVQLLQISQSAITCRKLIIETLKQDVKYVQS